ncbi:dTDP-4-dehydrorhamnose 3,5-epimerase [Streptomyces sp. CC53]|uniref:dTDP-4-dehydrorhamnose 3,5-epimerase family protein n=1 Tax=unclassified Streptomyces TaxID=2593676 RepID=UPI0008DC5CA0|nr:MULTISPECIES: dTDP-4-dehydrorhamnose 3,5-epimerase family protein [unclassified Streptomyces]OII63365.1 dTDP-4-dehydrorhamnose 3,5-epimerase [Streptomyces sp. CC53]OII69432.1 dTDP-4-dehydrorhamnose 3,5-epimerase [Streptomyces sp. CC77]
MRVEETGIPGTFRIDPEQLSDSRGVFYEALRTDDLERAAGISFRPRQINYSVSRRHTLRGIHSVHIPPGQAKFVTCVRGALRDIVVDLRVGSPAFGRHRVTALDAASGRSLYVPEGVGHGFLALTDDTCVCYAVSTPYVPGTQIDIHPLDPDLDLPWECAGTPLISDKDAKAPTLAEALAAGALPAYAAG